MLYILTIVVSLIIGGLIIFFILRPKLKSIKEYNQKIEDTEREAEIKLQTLQENTKIAETAYEQTKAQWEQAKIQLNEIYDRTEEVNKRLNQQSKDAEETAKNFYDKIMSVYSERIDIDTKEQQKNFEKAIQEYQIEYENVMNECANEYKEKIGFLQDECINLNLKLTNIQSAVAAATEERKRAAEMENKEQFYKIQLSNEDKIEIKKLREIIPYLRDSEPINKVIWSVYYKNPTNDMIGRIIGTNIKTGIYKITNQENGKCYVGQSANIRDRWIQHIKRGIGAETPTRNKLYPEMYKLGPENFTFELLEECDRSVLNEREDYWQDFYDAINWGYSIK